MPEGPSIVILKNEIKSFKRKKIITVAGNTKTIDLKRLKGKTIKDFKSWGKHFLICFDGFTIKIHFLMFGSYSINARKTGRAPRLRLRFQEGEINFYTCSVKFIEGNINDVYDWTADVMNPKWDSKKAKQKLKSMKEDLVCDVLLDQNVFAGVGNIIKNEVLFRIKVHPKNKIKSIPSGKANELIKEAVNYSFDFLKWKKKFVLRKHWLVHTKKTCPNCGGKIIKEYLGKTNRRTFFCNSCQKVY